ncbi:MAG TPA: hypothetical protein VGO96_00680 [Pyrinomonadaceae bacterium]|nr:hypothetical protein [Pyrinomonadaceae bacterium]
MKFKLFPRVASSLAAALFVCLVALMATAQTPPAQRQDQPPVTASPTPSPSPTASTTTATDNQDLSITANVTARELLFEVVPNPKVEFTGQPRRDTVWEAERTNLPPQVQPGVTYRDIGIRLTITSVFANIERIVAEALGEIPASDDSNTLPQTPQPGASPPQTDNTPQATASNATKAAPARKNSHATTRRGRN